MSQFIDMKRKLGFEYKTGSFILSKIDNLAEIRKETSPGITKDFAEDWSKKQPNESEHYRCDRIRFLVQFSSYLCDVGIQSYIPKLPRSSQHTFIPYIYSKQEIDDIFKASDKLRLKSHANFNTSLISIPALIRLLYCTGIRINEALAIRKRDINLDEKYLRITDSKNGKERIIPISDSLVSVCKEYVGYRNHLLQSNIQSEYFFVRLNGQKCSYKSIGKWFKKCLNGANIKYMGEKYGPRIHDLRHTFAVTSLANMADSGIDLYASLPILSCYLGHQSLDATNHYVRLTANMYPDLIKDVDMICLDVFPKFKNYEAN